MGFLQDSLYLGQFLAYIGPLYHFGIVKVCILSKQIGKSIIIVLEMLWSKTWVQKLLHNPLFGRLYIYDLCMYEWTSLFNLTYMRVFHACWRKVLIGRSLICKSWLGFWLLCLMRSLVIKDPGDVTMLSNTRQSHKYLCRLIHFIKRLIGAPHNSP